MAANQLKEAIELAKSGDLITARQAFVAIIKTDPQQVLAWLWLADLVEDPQEKINLLERCQKINPDDPMVREALVHFKEQTLPPDQMPDPVSPDDVRAMYETEDHTRSARKKTGWLKSLAWLVLISGMLTGLYFAIPLIRQIQLPLSAAASTANAQAHNPAAATWTPQSTPTPTITPTGTPVLPVGFGTQQPPAAAPITLWDADQLVPFAEWGSGVVLHSQSLPDGTILALTSRGYSRFDAASGETLAQWKADVPWRNAVADTAGDWILAASTVGLQAAHSQSLDQAVLLNDTALSWKILAIASDGSIAAAVNGDNQVLVWDLPSGTLRFDLPVNYGQITALALSPDGTQIAIGGHVGFVWLLDSGSGNEINRFFDLEGAVNALAFSSDGRWLASAGAPRTVAVWDLPGRKIHHHVYQEISSVSALGWSPTADVLAIGLDTGEILVWDDAGRTLSDTLSRHHAAVLGFSFAPGGSMLYSFAKDGAILGWDLSQTLTYQTLYPDIPGSTFASVITPNGKYLVMTGSGSQIHIYDLATLVEIATLKGHLGSVYALDVSADGKYLLSAGRDGSVRLWSLEEFDLVANLGSHAGYARSAAFSPDGSLAASAGADEMVKLWDLQTLTERRTLVGHTDQVQSVSFSPDGRFLFSSGDDGTVRQWDVQDGRLTETFESNSLLPIVTVYLLPDGEQFLSGDSEGILTLWSLSAGAPVAHLRGHEESINAITASPDGALFATGDAGGKLILWDAASLEPIRVLTPHTNPLVGMGFTDNVRAFFSMDRDGMVLRWETSGMQPPMQYGAFTSVVTAAAIAPGGNLAAVAGMDRTIRVIDLLQGDLRYQVRGLAETVSTLSFSPGGTHLAGGFDDGSIRFWAASTGVEQLLIAGDNASRVTLIQFEPSGRVLLVGRANHTIERRDVRSGALLETMVGHSGAITALQFAPNGVTLASGSADGMVFLWDTDDNSILRRINAHEQAVTGLQFSANGEWLVSSSLDGMLYTWRTTDAEELAAFGNGQPSSGIVLDAASTLLANSTDGGLCFWEPSSQQQGPCLQHFYGSPAAMKLQTDNQALLAVDGDGIIQCLAVAESHAPQQTPVPVDAVTTQVIPTPAPTSAVSLSSLPAPLYFLSDTSGSTQIWRLDADGRTVHQVTDESQPVTAYDVSRVADHIVFVSGNDLILIDKAAQTRWVLIDGEEIPPNNNDARLALEITAPVFSPDGWRIAFGLNGVHIYSILENTDEVLLENDLEAGSLDNTLYTPIYFSPGGNNLYIHQSTRSGPGLIVLSSWTGERYAGPLPGPCCQPIMNADQDAVIFSGQDKYGNSAGLWVIDVWYDQLTQILPPPESGQTYQVNAFPFQSEDGSLMFFYALADGGEAPPLMLARAADDGTSLLQVIRGDSYQNLQDALWADDGAFVLVVDPTDGKIKKLMANDTPPIILPVSGTMMRWGG